MARLTSRPPVLCPVSTDPCRSGPAFPSRCSCKTRWPRGTVSSPARKRLRLHRLRGTAAVDAPGLRCRRQTRCPLPRAQRHAGLPLLEFPPFHRHARPPRPHLRSGDNKGTGLVGVDCAVRRCRVCTHGRQRIIQARLRRPVLSEIRRGVGWQRRRWHEKAVHALTHVRVLRSTPTTRR